MDTQVQAEATEDKSDEFDGDTAENAGPAPDAAEASPQEDTGQEADALCGEELALLRARAEERDDFENRLRRAKADYENLQKRSRRERESWTRYAT